MPRNFPKPILDYPVGPLPVRGAVTVEIVAPASPLQALIDAQYLDSKTMSRRPGMYIKYMPYLYSPISGRLFTGGCYAFDTYENAKDYARWMAEDYEVGEEGKKLKFWEQPMFQSHRSWVWRVVGAHALTDLKDQGCMRLVHWRYKSSDAERALGEAFPALKDSVERMGGGAVWLLHNPQERMIGVQLVFNKEPGNFDENSAEKLLRNASAQRPLENLLPRDLGLDCFYDRTSLLLTLWLPRSRSAGGTELYVPLLPEVVPDITHNYD